jgi:sugar lactone lactonase YvrE
MTPPAARLTQPVDVGHDLSRPECVLCGRDGTVYVSDWRGGVTAIAADGLQTTFAADDAPDLRPNGIAIDRDGSFLLADLGERGGVWRLGRDGRLTPYCVALDGQPLPPANFVTCDRAGRVWITVSTRLVPRALGYRPTAADGFIVVVTDRGARLAADGLGYTNELVVDPSGDWLYVNETFARRLSRFRIGTSGDLGRRETVAVFGAGTFPDGLALDAEGGIWVVSLVSNRVIRIDPAGRQDTVIEDADPDWLVEVETAFQGSSMGRPHLDTVRSRRLQNVTSLAFGGPDLRTAYLGCLAGHTITAWQSTVAGVPLPHWEWT